VIDGNSTYLKPLNSRYPTKDMTGIEFETVGVAVQRITDL
jgi:SOS-response transcriptional repressor LexA